MTSFYFYDLETSGFNPRAARILQFGGQRTDLNLQPIDEPHSFYIKLSLDVLPDPDASLVTSITPQLTQSRGISEVEFLKFFYKQVVKPDTTFVGFNNIRFDDEFMRFLHYRNFYDAYEWQWKAGSSRWDLLDVVRMTRALRPDGINWPVNAEGLNSNQLTLLSGINKLDHSAAHDALNDVQATIALAQLLKTKQPRLFDYLLKLRKKDKAAHLAHAGQPFVYTSGKYPSEFEKTTIVQTLADHPARQGVLVYDLRFDPKPFLKLSPTDLAAIWHRPTTENDLTLPIKTLQFNRCPAIAPLATLDKKSLKRLMLDMNAVEQNRQKLVKQLNWPETILLALDILNQKQQTKLFNEPKLADNQLYDGFFEEPDKRLMAKIRRSLPEDLTKFTDQFTDQRLRDLLPLYKARNFAANLTVAEKTKWHNYCREKFVGSSDNLFDNYFARIEVLRKETHLTAKQTHVLNELFDYGKSLKTKFV